MNQRFLTINKIEMSRKFIASKILLLIIILIFAKSDLQIIEPICLVVFNGYNNWKNTTT